MSYWQKNFSANQDIYFLFFSRKYWFLKYNFERIFGVYFNFCFNLKYTQYKSFWLSKRCIVRIKIFFGQLNHHNTGKSQIDYQNDLLRQLRAHPQFVIIASKKVSNCLWDFFCPIFALLVEPSLKKAPGI